MLVAYTFSRDRGAWARELSDQRRTSKQDAAKLGAAEYWTELRSLQLFELQKRLRYESPRWAYTKELQSRHTFGLGVPRLLVEWMPTVVGPKGLG